MRIIDSTTETTITLTIELDRGDVIALRRLSGLAMAHDPLAKGLAMTGTPPDEEPCAFNWRSSSSTLCRPCAAALAFAQDLSHEVTSCDD